jgi:hypothetical protein
LRSMRIARVGLPKNALNLEAKNIPSPDGAGFPYVG